MRALVTGVGGFVGSHLAERLCLDGWSVVGVDSMTDYYEPDLKYRNLDVLLEQPEFEFSQLDLALDSLNSVLDGVDVVFHQAGQPGVRSSWASFDRYLQANVEGTHRLLEALAGRTDLRRFVFASSSSVYGDADDYPTSEDTLPRPQSPYGVSKLAAEHLCGVYARNFGVPAVSLRYFTVYGPRQRPDMAMSRLIASALEGHQFPLFGDGTQVRDFTYVDDVVEANVLAAHVEVEPGFVANVAGGSPTTMRGVIEKITELTGRKPSLKLKEESPGDVKRTGGSTERIRSALGWKAVVDLDEGLKRQVDWHIGLSKDRELMTAPGLGRLMEI